MSKPRAIPLAAQVEAAVERAEKAEGQIAALDYGIKAAHHRARCLKGELTKLQAAQKAAKARIAELEAVPPPAFDYFGKYLAEMARASELDSQLMRAQTMKLAAESTARYAYAERDKYRAEAEALRQTNAALTRVPVPATLAYTLRDDSFWPSVAAYGGLAGLCLGALVGGLLL